MRRQQDLPHPNWPAWAPGNHFISGCVYFITNGYAIKIGFSDSPMVRMSHLQTASPYELALLLEAPGDLIREGKMHDQFRHLHMRGEWFRATPELYSFICKLRDEPGATGSPSSYVWPAGVMEEAVTKLTPEAEAFGRKMNLEGANNWPDDLMRAATMLRMELEASRLKSWKIDNHGPKKLAEYHDNFQRLYAEWISTR